MDEQTPALNPALYKLHRLFFIAMVVFAALMALMGIGSLVRGQEGAGIGFAGIALAPIAAAHWYAARGAQTGAGYGKVISRIIGSFWLIGFPVGTILGIYAWSKTSDDKWVDAPAQVSSSAA
jgi:hypothetical protein